MLKTLRHAGSNPLPRQSQTPDPTVDLPLNMEASVNCRNGLELIEPKNRMVENNFVSELLLLPLSLYWPYQGHRRTLMLSSALTTASSAQRRRQRGRPWRCASIEKVGRCNSARWTMVSYVHVLTHQTVRVALPTPSLWIRSKVVCD